MGLGATRKIELVCLRERELKEAETETEMHRQTDRDRETLGDYLEILSERRFEYLHIFVNSTAPDLLPCM